MNAEADQPSGGFFSRVLGMVRGKAAQEQSLGEGSLRDAGSSTAKAGSSNEPAIAAVDTRRELRATARRKRRNDAIRHQEFAQLRKLRAQHMAADKSKPPAAENSQLARSDSVAPATTSKPADPSSSLPEEQKSAQTLRKIDVIEAQMSRQWWGGDGDEGGAVALSRSARLDLSAETGEDGEGLPQPVVEFHSVLELDELAILFAHGDVQGTQTRLLELLAQYLQIPEPAANHNQQEVLLALWHAAMDWCRATGDEAGFESLAIDYATHFEKSPPMWVSLPQQLGLPALLYSAGQSGQGKAAKKAPDREFHWQSPATVTAAAVASLQKAHDGTVPPWAFSWQGLKDIAAPAVGPLAQLLESWADQPGQFVWSHAAPLLQLLEQHTESGQTQQPASWWLLRLAVLRLMDRMQDYELVALEYCTTYEISPPDWRAPQAQCLVEEEGQADTSILQDSRLLSTAFPGAAQQGEPLDLQHGLLGVVEGDIQERMQPLAEGLATGQPLDIDCSLLIRLDFIAAGGLLNWAADLQAKGHALRFVHLHYLIAAFLHVLGMSQHAKLMLRV